MSAYWQDGKERARRRGAGAIFVQPPAEHLTALRWHMLQAPDGIRRMEWQPGIMVWYDEKRVRCPAEAAGRDGWTYIGVADDQSGATR
jgi:hypothetical protein